ncbi:MAG: SurA N-terminal domain-containing protein [Polaromonas sp.]|jgi:peptidyl-prolyl cis-trans isomerase D|nr:SurA N-terminal domain-containing protein [Polaromonas sp.]
MFDFIRKHTKITMWLLFLLIVPSFVLLGLNDHSRSGDSSATVARVDGKNITQADWDAAHRIEVDQIRASMPTIDVKLLDSPEARYATLERMVRDRVMAAAAAKSLLTTSDQRLARELQANPQIAALRKPDGSLDMERYRLLVGAQGMTPDMFEASVRADLSTRQVMSGVTATGFSSAGAADSALNAYFEKRELQLARFSPATYAAKLKSTDADLEQFYQANQTLFRAPEQASIEYVLLDADAVSKTIVVNAQDLKTYYDQNIERLSGPEERRASHILINAPKTAPAAERAAAKAKATELLAQVRKAPETFADTARKNSQDTGSAAQGGDLEFFARGAMVKPFEDAAFTLKKGEISDLVESDFGYHIIRLTDIKTPKQRSFEELRPTLEADLKKQQVQQKFAESAELFTNGVYEQADSLKPVAERLKLDIRSAANVSRSPAASVTGVLANPKFLAALFATDSIEKKRNTEAIEVGPNQLAAGRIVQYTPVRTLPMAEVKDNVRARWLADRSAEEARKEGSAKLAEWKTNAAAAALPESLTISRIDAQKLPGPILDAVLRADPAALPVLVGVDLGGQGYAVVKVTKVLPREPRDAAAAQQERAQYAQWWTAAEGMAYYKLMQERFKVEITAPRPVPGQGLSEANATQAASR